MGRASAHAFSPEVLVDLRRSAGLSQAALGDALGVSSGSVRAWERGRKIPQADMLGRVAELLSAALSSTVTVADLVDIPDTGRTLADWRVLRALTQGEAARRAGLSTSHYGAIERGDSPLAAHSVPHLADALGITPDEVIAAAGEGGQGG